MTKLEAIVIYTIAAVFLISQHLVSSSYQYCNGAMKLVSVDDNGSCNASTYQLLYVRHLGCAQDEGKLLLFILPQESDSVPCEYASCCDAGEEQFQVELCENITLEALCNRSTQCHAYLNQDQCTPGNLSVSQNVIDTSSITLNWSQPLYNYIISCCPSSFSEIGCTQDVRYKMSAQSVIITGLKAYTKYECCVWEAHNDTGQASMTCQCVQTAEAVPDPPTNLIAYPVMTNHFLLTWKPPQPEFQHGMIQSYHIKIIEKGPGGKSMFESTGDADPFFLTGSLKEGHTYTFSVAANYSLMNKLGNFSNATDILLPQEGIMTPLFLSVAIGLLTVFLIVVTIVAITVCNRMRKQNKSLIREIQEYEMISKYSAIRHDSNSLPERYSAIKKRDSNRKQPILPPAHLAADYLTPTMTKTTGSIENRETNSDTKTNQEEKVNTDESKNLDSEAKEETKRNETCNKDSDENPYQSLIVPMANATSVTIDGYVKIIRSRVGSLEGQETPAPKTPPIPPKPESDYSLKSSIPQLSLASELPPMSENMYASRSGTL